MLSPGHQLLVTASPGSLQQRDSHLTSDNSARSLLRQAGKAVTKTQRLTFCAGIVNVCFTMFLLGRDPSAFWMWHAPKSVLLIGIRLWRFKERGAKSTLPSTAQ